MFKHQPSTLKHWGSVLLSVALLAGCSDQQPAQTAEQAPPAPQPQPAPELFVYQGATVIPGDGSAPIDNAVMIVDGDTFVTVGPAGEVDVPAGAVPVDLTGTTVMPAIIDTHTHLNIERAALLEDLRRRADYGVGAALSLGRDYGDAVWDIQGDTVPGAARYLTAGRGITAPEPGRSDIPHWVTTEQEARTAVREEAMRGVDIIKIWVDDRGGQYDPLSPELYRVIIEEAHRYTLPVTAHIYYQEDARELLRAGVDAFAHGIRDSVIDDETVTLFQDNPDVVLVPNLNDRGVADDFSWLEGTMPGDQLQQIQAESMDDQEQQDAFSIQARNLDMLNDAGVTIALGTDGNTPWGAHIEMEDMVIAGMTPMEVITAATADGAAFLGLDDTGTIETGKSADFIVLEANPLEDITNTRRIVDVYLRGDQVERGGM